MLEKLFQIAKMKPRQTVKNEDGTDRVTWLDAPFMVRLFGSLYVGASTGHFICLVQSDERPELARIDTDTAAVWEHELRRARRPAAVVSLAELRAWVGDPPTPSSCGRCGATGRIDHACGCPRCEAQTDPCKLCDGAGTVPADECVEMLGIRLNQALLRTALDAVIATDPRLPDCTVWGVERTADVYAAPLLVHGAERKWIIALMGVKPNGQPVDKTWTGPRVQR